MRNSDYYINLLQVVRFVDSFTRQEDFPYIVYIIIQLLITQCIYLYEMDGANLRNLFYSQGLARFIEL